MNVKKNFKPVQETKSLEELKQAYLQEELDLLESFEIEILEDRIAFMAHPTGGCGGCACELQTTGCPK